MADISDVETALVAASATALYPTGIQGPSTANINVKIFRGWPVPSTLDADISAGVACVSVFARPGPSRLTTRFARHWVERPTLPPGIAASTTATSTTFTGITTGPTDCGLRAFGQHYTIHVGLGAIAAAIATTLAAMVPGVTVSGFIVTVSRCHDLDARTATPARLLREIRRQSQTVSLIV